MAPVGRREARERAFSLLYEADTKSISPGSLLEELPVRPDAFTTALVEGVKLVTKDARISDSGILPVVW